MKGITKNIYSIVALGVFAASVFFLVLILSIYSKSTAVDGTTVGNIYIGDKETSDDKRKYLLTEANKWKKQAKYTIVFQNVEMMIGHTRTNTGLFDDNNEEIIRDTYEGLEMLLFDVQTTMSHLKLDKKNDAYYIVNPGKYSDFQNEIGRVYGQKVLDNLDLEKLMSSILENARKMVTIKVFDLDLDGYLMAAFRNSIVNEITLKNLNELDIDKITQYVSEIEIKPQSQTTNKLGFSAVQFFTERTAYLEAENKKIDDANRKNNTSDPLYDLSISNELYNIIVTGIAASVQKSSLSVTVKNQDIFERAYAYNDMTARVNVKDGTDLKILNPETTSYFVKLVKPEGTNSELRFELVGCQFANTYKIRVDREKTAPAPIMTKDSRMTLDVSDPKYVIDEERGIFYVVTSEGTDSELITYVRITTYSDETTTEEPVYLKQEFYKGISESWTWNDLPDTYIYSGGVE